MTSRDGAFALADGVHLADALVVDAGLEAGLGEKAAGEPQLAAAAPADHAPGSDPAIAPVLAALP